jgi:cytoskeletal protein CcmA (bactofilin family)
VSTFLGNDAVFDGVLEFKGTIRVDGRVKGKIMGNNGTLIIGDKSSVEAEIIVDIAIVRGEVRGTIEARDRIEAYPPARIIGDLRAPVISIHSGVIFNGASAMEIPLEKTVKPTEKTK